MLKIHVDTSGAVTALKSIEATFLDTLGDVVCRRVSHIWPSHPVKRIAFRVLRFVFGERGRIATWCRSWYGPWQVRFADQPRVVVFTHQSRRVCIAWEIQTINERLANENQTIA